MEQRRRYAVYNLEQGVLLKHHYQTEIDTPDNEVPACSVPHSSEKPYHHDVKNLMAAVASHRYVDIVAEEAAERNVPAAPEIADGVAAVGVTEVLVEVETKAAANADSHVAVAREVEINLESESQNTYPCTRGRQRGKASNKELLGNLGELVGQDDLLAKTNEEAVDALCKIRGRHMAPSYLLGHRAVAHNRAGNELREHRYIEQQTQKALLNGRLAAIDINEIGD